MKIKPIHTKKDLSEALARIDEIIDAKRNTPEYDELDILSTLVEAYEEKHSPIPPADPIEAIKFRMDQLGLKKSDIAQYLGGKNRASEVLSRKRSLSLRMIRNLFYNLHIPSDILLYPTKTYLFAKKLSSSQKHTLHKTH